MEQNEQVNPFNNKAQSDFDRFKEEYHNVSFKTSRMTYFSMVFVILFVAQSFFGDTTAIFENMNETLRVITYIITIAFLWVLYGVIYVSIQRENSSILGIGLVKIRVLDFARGFAILLTLFVVATFVSMLMASIGFTMPGEVEMFLPQELLGKILWVVMSFTAGYCEEAVFRGYLMTRIRLLGKFNSWTIPVIVSSLLFGIPHLYQGFAGVVVITILGAIFAISYVRYKTIWPAIIAHFFLDFLNLFIPWFESMYERIFGI